MAVAWRVSEKNALALVSTIFYLKFVKKKKGEPVYDLPSYQPEKFQICCDPTIHLR